MVYRCKSPKEMACTGCCAIGVLLLVISTILCHIALDMLCPAIIDLPKNLVTGIEGILNFGALEAEIGKVKVDAQDALALCNITAPGTQCSNPPQLNPYDKQDSSVQLNKIKGIFDSTLDTVKSVSDDKYLGLDQFQGAGKELATIQANLTQLLGQTQPIECVATVPLYCAMFTAGDHIVQNLGPVKDGIKKITENDAVEQFDQYSGNVKLLHALPYISWLAMVFYLCFFVSKNATSPCRGGSGKGCVACFCHGLFFLIFLVLTVAIVAASIIVVGFANSEEYKLEGATKGDPTIAELLGHLEKAFPEFYDVVLKNLIDGLAKLYNAFVVFMIAEIVILIHTCGTCCCAPYKEQESDADKGAEAI